MKKMTANGTTITITSRKDVQNWLNEYRFNENHVATLTNRLEGHLKLLYAIEEVNKENPGVIDAEEFATLNAQIERVKEMLQDAVDRLGLQCGRIISMVESIPSPEIRKVIEDHYFKNMTLEASAIEMGVSISKVKYLHRAGLDYLANMK